MVFDKVFTSTQHHGVSINELWEQINKLKEHTGLVAHNKDGVYLSTDSVPGLFNDNNNNKKDSNNKDNKDKDGDKSRELNPPSDQPENSNISHNNSNEDIQNINNNSSQLQSQLDAQKKRIEKLEKRFDYLSNRSEDKYESYDHEINKLIKNRLDDFEGQLKAVSEKVEQNEERQKKHDFNLREQFKHKTEELEVGIKAIKRNLTGGGDESGKPTTLLQNQKKMMEGGENSDPKRSQSDQEKLEKVDHI